MTKSREKQDRCRGPFLLRVKNGGNIFPCERRYFHFFVEEKIILSDFRGKYSVISLPS
jgi:hypothetical protein